METITPFLWFNDQVEEAARFYTSIFKKSRIGKIARYGKAGEKASGRPAGSVTTVEFELAGQKFVALNGRPQFGTASNPLTPGIQPNLSSFIRSGLGSIRDCVAKVLYAYAQFSKHLSGNPAPFAQQPQQHMFKTKCAVGARPAFT